MDIDQETLAQHAMELEMLAPAIEAVGYATQVLPASEQVPLPTLLVGLGEDEDGRERSMGVTILPLMEEAFTHTQLIQFYVPLPFEIPDDTHDDVLAAAAHVNVALVVGHFAARGTELYHRYVLANPTEAAIDAELIKEVVGFMTFQQLHFGEYLEGVAEGEIALSALPDVIDATS